MLIHLRPLWRWLMFLGLITPGFAQQGAGREQSVSFSDQTKEMLMLIENHREKIKSLNATLDKARSKVNDIDELLKYPKNIKPYRDTCQRQLVRLRKQTEENNRQLKDMYFQWHKVSRQAMAVFTRYGELSASGRPPEELKRFMTAYREMVFEIENLVAKLEETNNIIDFLLTSKLN